MVASLALMGATAVGIKVAFGKRGTVPAIAHVAAGVGLLAIYGFKLGWGNLLGTS